MDDKDLVIQNMRRELAELRKQYDAAVSDIETLLSQDSIKWRCWACAHTYDATPCRNLCRPCNAQWRGLANIARVGAEPKPFATIQQELGHKEEFKPRRKH